MIKQLQKFCLTGSALLFSLEAVFAQNPGIQAGAQAIQQASSDLQAYFEPVTTLIYIIAALVGLFGGFRIYSKWQNGDQDVQKSAIGWVGAVLFLLSIAAVLQAVFFA
jgi:predicted transporter